MIFSSFSEKQLKVLCWWHRDSKYYSRSAIICDGAVRSGKTLCLSLSFLFWSFSEFDEKDFALCGKTIGALRRNLLNSFISTAKSLGFGCREVLSRNFIEISYKGKTNRFHLFGGKDEGSASLIQGITLAGVLFDEVALMPRSFVEQAMARCSIENSKLWFNCNPEHPSHWFYLNWIKKAEEKNVLYLHFKMKDNPSLSKEVLKRYENLYHGIFYDRFILGEWTAAHGAVYPMFSHSKHVVSALPTALSRFIVSCDYGTTNPTSFGLWGYHSSSDSWYRTKEYYHSSKETGIIKTDTQYAHDLELFIEDKTIEAVVIDPSAASFIHCVRSRSELNVVPANNKVLDGIRLVASALSENKLLFHESCKAAIKEFSLYRWSSKPGTDEPIQSDDHAMDDVRYFVSYILSPTRESSFYAISSGRKT